MNERNNSEWSFNKLMQILIGIFLPLNFVVLGFVGKLALNNQNTLSGIRPIIEESQIQSRINAERINMLRETSPPWFSTFRDDLIKRIDRMDKRQARLSEDLANMRKARDQEGVTH